MRLANCLLAGWVVLLGACDDKESDAPPPPSIGGTAATGANTGGRDGGLGPPRPAMDSGMIEDDEDGGSEPIDGGALLTECVETPVVHVPNTDVGPDVEASTTSPLDFEVSRLLGTWEGDCSAPVFRVELSNGECPDGDGHQLTFLIAAAALDDGNLRIGLNTVLPEPNDIGTQIRYTRPATAMPPEGEWGTCAGATGNIDIVDEAPSTEKFSRLRAEFDLDLTACTVDTEGLQTVRGMFDVLMRRGLDEFCPDM